MGEDDNIDVSNEINETNDAREEDIVSDVDADTKDIEETANRNEGDIEKRFSSIESTLDKILGQISSIREAQGVMVENGAVIHEVDDDLDFTDADSFVPPAELNLLI